MSDWCGPRRPSWRFELLDRENQPIGELDGVTGGSLELAALSRLMINGSLALHDRGQEIDWLSHRFRASYDPGIPGVEAFAVATMLFASPLTHVRSGVRSWDVELLSTLAVLDEDTTDATYSLPAGAPIVQTVVSLIQSAGETQIAVTPSPAVTRSALVWEAGTPKLTVINDLLTAAGYWSLWVDGTGQFRIEPYVDPGERRPSWEFFQGETAIHTPDWDCEQDMGVVPNQFIVVGQGDDTKPALVGVARNENPDSPFSYQSRGRWITEKEDGAEIADQSAANLLAQRRLLDRMSPVAKLQVQHAIVPVNPNEVVAFRDSGHDVRATVQRMSFEFAWDSLCKADWREAS